LLQNGRSCIDRRTQWVRPTDHSCDGYRENELRIPGPQTKVWAGQPKYYSGTTRVCAGKTTEWAGSTCVRL